MEAFEEAVVEVDVEEEEAVAGSLTPDLQRGSSLWELSLTPARRILSSRAL